jgi:putative transposase
MQATEELASQTGIVPVCEALGVSRASLYRRRRPRQEPRRTTPARALSEPERQEVLRVLHSERFVDAAPAQVHAALLEEGSYLCAPRTMYRILADSDELRERRDQLQHPPYTKPELVATAPKQVWSWDITKLKGPVKLSYFYLYVILDIFSRYVVGWMIAGAENAGLAEQLIEQTCVKQGIAPGQLKFHSDRGSPMRSKTVAQLLGELGIEKSHGRPHVSNDNPYSEALFKTAKYRPAVPDRFASPAHTRAVFRAVFDWYNNQHHHSGIVYLTPAVVHYGRAETVLEACHRSRVVAYLAHPERFVNGPPQRVSLPPAVWINPPEKTTCQDGAGSTIVAVDDPEVVPACSSYSQFHKLGVTPRDLAAAPETSH